MTAKKSYCKQARDGDDDGLCTLRHWRITCLAYVSLGPFNDKSEIVIVDDKRASSTTRRVRGGRQDNNCRCGRVSEQRLGET